MKNLGHLSFSAWGWILRILILLILSSLITFFIYLPFAYFYSPLESKNESFKNFGYSLKRGSMILFYACILFLYSTNTLEVVDNAESNANVLGVIKYYKEGPPDIKEIILNPSGKRFLLALGWITLSTSILLMVLSKIIIFQSIANSNQDE